MVPFLDLGAAHAELRAEIDAAIRNVLDGGKFILGGEVEAFEAEFASYVGTTQCIGVGNGLDALELAIRGLGLDAGEEVIVPANTFIATWLAVTRAGGSVVPVEPLETTYNLDPHAVAAAITPRTRGVIAVHLYGQPAQMSALRALANRHGIWLLEDAAQAHGATWQGRRAGSLGDAAAWSFYPSKNLGALGDAGAVTTSRADVADAVRLLRNYGSSDKYVHERPGVNSRLDELQAAVLRIKLPVLDTWNERRAAVAAAYLNGMKHSGLRLPIVEADAAPVWHLFAVRTDGRDELQRGLMRMRISSQVHYPTPPHLQAAYAWMGLPEGSFPITELTSRQLLSLPIGPHLETNQVERVIEAVTRA